MSVLVVGSVALDTVKTASGEANEVLGGSASYFSVAARLFAPVTLVAVVGEDFPEAHRTLLHAKGIDLSGLETAPGKTFRWGGEYTSDFSARTTHYTHLNVFAEFRPKLPAAARQPRILFLANIAPELQLGVLDQVERPDLVVLDTMNYWIQGAPDALAEVISRVDVILINDEEARMLTGESHLLRAARRVLERGPSLVIVKKGEHGAFLVGRDFLFTAPAYPVETLCDPTGAGDTFAGGFVGHLARCGTPSDPAELRRAAIYGTVAASFAVEGFSLDRLSGVALADLESRFAELKRIASF